MPAKARNHAVAIALVLDLEHHAFIWLVNSIGRFRDYAVKAGSLEAPKPILCYFSVACSRSEMDGSSRIQKQRLKFPPTHFKRLATEVTTAKRKQIKKHNRCRRLF